MSKAAIRIKHLFTRAKKRFQDPESAGQSSSSSSSSSSSGVASGIFEINTAVSSFERLVNALGTPKDTPEFREKLHKARLHIAQLVNDTSTKLYLNTSSDKKKVKLAKDFEAAVRKFQEAQRLAAEREPAYAPLTAPQGLAILALNHSGDGDSGGNGDGDSGGSSSTAREIDAMYQQTREILGVLKDLSALLSDSGMDDDIIRPFLEENAKKAAEAENVNKASEAEKSRRWWDSSRTCLLLVLFGIIFLLIVLLLVLLLL